MPFAAAISGAEKCLRRRRQPGICLRLRSTILEASLSVIFLPRSLQPQRNKAERRCRGTAFCPRLTHRSTATQTRKPQNTAGIVLFIHNSRQCENVFITERCPPICGLLCNLASRRRCDRSFEYAHSRQRASDLPTTGGTCVPNAIDTRCSHWGLFEFGRILRRAEDLLRWARSPLIVQFGPYRLRPRTIGRRQASGHARYSRV